MAKRDANLTPSITSEVNAFLSAEPSFVYTPRSSLNQDENPAVLKYPQKVENDLQADESNPTATDLKPRHILSSITYTQPLWLATNGQQLQTGPQEEASYEVDEDGDIVLHRRGMDVSKRDAKVIIEHATLSNLDGVGEQIWRGALFMSDFLLSFPDNVRKKYVIEIGSGTGLVSIVASKMCKAKLVVATDVERILPLLNRNCHRNGVTIFHEQDNNFRTSVFDVIDPTSLKQLAIVVNLQNIDVVLGADVIYDDEITRGIVRVMSDLCVKKFHNAMNVEPLVFLFAIEKRFNFMIDGLKVTAPAFDYFKRLLEDLRLSDILNRNIVLGISEMCPSDVEQYFCYQRCKDLILVKVIANCVGSL